MSSEYPLLDLQSIPSFVSSVDMHAFFANVTPEIASNIVKNHNYTLNRTLNKRKMLELSSFMRDGTFQPLTSPLNFSVERANNAAVLVDGQHRLSAMIETEKTYLYPILVTTQKSSDIYPKIDRGKPRTLKDAIRSGRIADKMGLSESATLKGAVGLRVILNGYTVTQSHSKAFSSEKTILETLTGSYKEELNRIYEMVDHLELARQLTGRLPMSMFLALYKTLSPTDFSKADEFIYGCGSNIGLGEGDVRRLVYIMYSTTLRSGSARKRTMSKLEEMSTLLMCWDYWYKGKPHSRKFSEAQRLKNFRRKPNLTGTNITYAANVPIAD